MKKAAILSITAFYLLLTTGMFVCAVHRAAKSIAAKPEMAMGNHNKDCCKNDGKDCSKKHGNYVIKENIKPATEVQFMQTALPVPHLQFRDFVAAVHLVQVTLPQQTKAPPDRSGKAIIIQNHTFLI